MIPSMEPIITIEPTSQENLDDDVPFPIEKSSWDEPALLHPSPLASLWSPSPTPSFNDDDDFLSPIGSVVSLQDYLSASSSDSPFLPQNTITNGSPYNAFWSLTPEPLLSETINPALLSGSATPVSPLSPIMSEYLNLEELSNADGLEEQPEIDELDDLQEEYVEPSPSPPYVPALLASSRSTTKRKRTPSPSPSPETVPGPSRPTKRIRTSSPSPPYLLAPIPSARSTSKRKRLPSPSPQLEPVAGPSRSRRSSAKRVAPQYTVDDDSEYEEPKGKRPYKRRKAETKKPIRAGTKSTSTLPKPGWRRNTGDLTQDDVNRLSKNPDEKLIEVKAFTPCTICGKIEAWTGSQGWMRHLVTHLGDEERMKLRPSCRWCEATFAREDALKRHLNNSCKKRPRG